MSLAMPEAQGVRLQTPSRLHLGIFNLPEGGYGGIGLAIDQPRVRLAVTEAGGLTASGPQSDRALKAAEALAGACGIRRGAHIEVADAITPHVGLGSGTQIALAACMALARLWGIAISLEEIAHLAGRAARSRIGLEAFRRGGFVAHASWRSGETSTRVRRFPPAWRFVVVAPRTGGGLSGPSEARAFTELPPMRPITQREARNLVEQEILPGVEQADLIRFGQGLMALQAIVGDYFAPVQGGRYAHPLGAGLAEALLNAGAAGVGQSSWGPSICGVVGSEAQAEQVRRSVPRRFPGADLVVWVAGPDNQGTRWEWHGA